MFDLSFLSWWQTPEELDDSDFETEDFDVRSRTSVQTEDDQLIAGQSARVRTRFNLSCRHPCLSLFLAFSFPEKLSLLRTPFSLSFSLAVEPYPKCGTCQSIVGPSRMPPQLEQGRDMGPSAAPRLWLVKSPESGKRYAPVNAMFVNRTVKLKKDCCLCLSQ